MADNERGKGVFKTKMAQLSKNTSKFSNSRNKRVEKKAIVSIIGNYLKTGFFKTNVSIL